MLYFYDPQKEMARYREKKEQEVKIKLDASQEKQQFMKLYE